MSGSHNGEPRHVDCVQTLLKRYGLSEDDLLCGTHSKFHVDSLVCPAANQCSGKHALFLIASVVAGWPITEYMKPDSRLHQTVQAALRERFFTDKFLPGLDGCSLPTYAVTLGQLAQGYARFSADELGDKFSLVRRSQIAASYYVGGTDRLESYLIGTYELSAKSGSDGLWAIGLPGMRLGLVGKVFSGSEPAVQAALIESLRQLRVVDPATDAYLQSYHSGLVKALSGQGAGEIKTCFPEFLSN
jgi:L-asparaginase II